MSSIHIHLSAHAHCGVHAGQERPQQAARQDLKRDLVAMLVLAMLEQILKAAAEPGGKGAGQRPASADGVCAHGQAGGVQPGGADGHEPRGALQPFFGLLLLLALLLKQGGPAGGDRPGANGVAEQVADGLGRGGQAPQGLAQAPETEAPSAEAPEAATPETGSSANEDAIAMMASAMREGHADSLMAGKDDKGLERRISEMSAGLREAFAPDPGETNVGQH